LPNPVVDIGREQFCILAENDEPPITGQSEPYTQKTQESDVSGAKQNRHHHILIYRIYENLLSIFPGLSNIVKRGFDRGKALNAFAKMKLDELYNPEYEIPQLEGALYLGPGQMDSKYGKGSVGSMSAL